MLVNILWINKFKNYLTNCRKIKRTHEVVVRVWFVDEAFRVRTETLKFYRQLRVARRVRATQYFRCFYKIKYFFCLIKSFKV